MPIGPTNTKAEKRRAMHTEMHKFKEGKLHSGSKHGPKVTNPKQAVAIGLSESGQSKQAKKLGQQALGGATTEIRNQKFLNKENSIKHGGKASNPSYDRSGHFPGNPGFNREGKAPYKEYNGGAHAKQPHGKSIGEPKIDTPHKGNSFQSELKEHWGSEAKGKTMKSGKEVGHTGPADRGSELVEDCGMGHEKQPHGKSIGAGRNDVAEHHKNNTFGGDAFIFKPPAAVFAHGYGHSITERRGPLRMSGVKGAHRIGHKSK